MKHSGIGRHKSAIAKVFIIYSKVKETTKTIIIIINNKTIFDYFQNDKDTLDSIRQFLILDIPLNLNIKIQVSGGGNTGQKKAICLALAKTFCRMGFSNILKNSIIKISQKNLLTQDSRIKERKKYGLKKARKAPQYSKR
uniref:Small ribosomal subunit protein uS9c n=1 Tax=Glaukea argentea TaxID=2894057 RepID=A0A386B1J4_9CHLO|nr:ribosomal protein S9 [Udotea argentea]AYC65581.1 ribosomal protein S9 [Udotea argentea]